MRRLGVLFGAVVLLAAGLTVAPPVPDPVAASGRNLAERLDVGPQVRQLVTVTNGGWKKTSAELRVWRRRGEQWRKVRGPITVALGWSGFVRAQRREQSTGTTPAGRFRLPSAFGNRHDPGTGLRYRHVDHNDRWPYEPRDAATYNLYQPFKARGSRWRADYVERLADYGAEYAYAVVIGFNLPGGVHWSKRRKQRVADEPADTARGGGIFLHVKEQRHTAGCVAAPLRQVRWLVRWLDPEHSPRIVMGPRRWLLRRF